MIPFKQINVASAISNPQYRPPTGSPDELEDSSAIGFDKHPASWGVPIGEQQQTKPC